MRISEPRKLKTLVNFDTLFLGEKVFKTVLLFFIWADSYFIKLQLYVNKAKPSLFRNFDLPMSMNNKKQASKDAYFGANEAEKAKLKILTKSSLFRIFDFPISMDNQKKASKDAHFGTKEAEKS